MKVLPTTQPCRHVQPNIGKVTVAPLKPVGWYIYGMLYMIRYLWLRCMPKLSPPWNKHQSLQSWRIGPLHWQLAYGMLKPTGMRRIPDDNDSRVVFSSSAVNVAANMELHGGHQPAHHPPDREIPAGVHVPRSQPGCHRHRLPHWHQRIQRGDIRRRCGQSLRWQQCLQQEAIRLPLSPRSIT